MAKNKLEIFISLVTAQAEKADRDLHAGMRSRIKQTSDAQSKAEKVKTDAAKAAADKIKKINADVDRDMQERAKAHAKRTKDVYAAQSAAVKAAADGSKRQNAAIEDSERHLESARTKMFQNRLAQYKREARASDDLHREQMSRARSTRAQVTQEQSQLRTSFTLWERLTGTIKTATKATEEGTEAGKKHGTAIMDIATAYTGLRVATEVGQALSAAMQTMARSSEEARDYIKGIVEEMERAREIAKELANLEGKKATGAYTADQARQASAVGATPEEFVTGKKAFQEYGAQFIGKEGATDAERAEEVKDKKVSYETSQEVQRRAMRMFGAMGLDPTEGMKLTATVVGKMGEANPNVSVDEIVLQVRRLAEAARTATGATGVGISQLQETIQESVGEGGELKSMEEAAEIMRTMQSVRPAEGSMLSRNLLRGLGDIRRGKKGEAEELGITKDMDTQQQLEQIFKRIPEIAEETGEKEVDVEQRFFHDSREFRAAKAVLNQGIRGKGLERTRKAMRAHSVESEKKEESDYMQGEIGGPKSQDSMAISDERERATRQIPAQAYKRESHRALSSSGDLEEPEGLVGAAMTGAGSAFGRGTRQVQEERALTVDALRRDLKRYPEGRDWLKAHPLGGIAGSVLSALTKGRVRPSGRHADEHWIGEAALEMDRIRKGNPAHMQHANPAHPGPGDFQLNDTPADQRIHAEQQRNRAAAAAHAQNDLVAKNLDAAAANVKKATAHMNKAAKVGLNPALPARPHVQRH